MRLADERLWLRAFRARMLQSVAALRIETARSRVITLGAERAAWALRRAGIAALLLLLLLATLPAGAQLLGPYKTFGAHITSQTTTTLVAAVSARTVVLYSLSACVDGNGATTSFTVQDTAGTNLVGTGVVYVVNPGQCFTWPLRPGASSSTAIPLGYITNGLGLALVTGTGNGPVEVFGEYLQQ